MSFLPVSICGWSHRLLHVVMATLLMTCGLAAETASVVTSNTAPAVNAAFTVSARLDGMSSFSCWGQVIHFDRTKLRLDAQSPGDLTVFVPDSRSLADINASGEIRAGGVYQSGSTYPNNAGGAGRVAVFSFTRIAAGATTVTAASRSGSEPFGWVVIAADGSSRSPAGAGPLTLNDPGAVNVAPSVMAGFNQIVTLPAVALLSGSVSDDGLPSNVLALAWSKISGPGPVTFSAADAASTNATFSMAGTYVLRLTASDGLLSGTSDVTVTVNVATGPGSGGGGGGTPPPPAASKAGGCGAGAGFSAAVLAVLALGLQGLQRRRHSAPRWKGRILER